MYYISFPCVFLSSASIFQYFPLTNFQITARVIKGVCCVAVIAGVCDDRNSAVAVIARWSLWASSGERGAGNSVYYIFSLCLLSIAFIFLRVFSVNIFTHYWKR